jgi:sortase A
MRMKLTLLSFILVLTLAVTGCSQDTPKTSDIVAPPAYVPATETETSTSPPNSTETKVSDSTKTESVPVVREGIDPVQIKIPAIQVEAEIENVGLLSNGQMGVPSDAFGVGWYELGAKPGEIGNAVLAGHVDSKTGPAVFYDLKKLKPGDEVVVSDSNGKNLTFIVKELEIYPRNSAPLEKVFGQSLSNRSQLNLITCTGTFNSKERTHEERLVVYTELKQD